MKDEQVSDIKNKEKREYSKTLRIIDDNSHEFECKRKMITP